MLLATTDSHCPLIACLLTTYGLLSEASGNNTVMVVTAMPETVALDVRSMVTVEASNRHPIAKR